ncbi:MAG: hypothetical protein K8R53_11180, partial [Bacteroidales bacterium]|nr:hypothetical protein [Bacteroidales bacterium]
MIIKILISSFLIFITIGLFGQNPILQWRFANPTSFYDSTLNQCVFQFDAEISCDMAGTFHSDLQMYFDYNTLAFGENIFNSGNSEYERLGMLLGEIAPGFPKYNIYGPQDGKPYRYVILS